jgi:ABC-2 type transport system ATP-binding protein
MIRTEALKRKYGDVLAVNEVSFEIGSREIVGLLGHNGAGKTTIMKMMTGYLEPSSGTITVNGADVWANRSIIQRQVGYLPENCPLYPEMTVMEYLDYAAVLRGVAYEKQSDQLRSVLQKANLITVAQKSISTLSRGFRQRLGVAQALINSPSILILDEPTNGLDPSQILEMRSLIRELAQTSTIVVSTHILQEVQAVCNRVIIINNGRVALDAAMKDLQVTAQLQIATDCKSEKCSNLCARLKNVRMIRSEHKDAHYHYILDVGTEDISTAAAAMNRMLIENGCDVYAMNPIVRDLETVFGDITAGKTVSVGGVSAERKANLATDRLERVPESATVEARTDRPRKGRKANKQDGGSNE